MRVGTRADKVHNQTVHEDHPHACGDKPKCKLCCLPHPGSSPCVWGQEMLSLDIIDKDRIIPMRVGTRRGSIIHSDTVKDHPHACGDKLLNSGKMSQAQGSSPCVWGQEQCIICCSTVYRIIPMRVGTSTVTVLLRTYLRDHPHACGDKTKEIKENSGFAKSTA